MPAEPAGTGAADTDDGATGKAELALDDMLERPQFDAIHVRTVTGRYDTFAEVPLHRVHVDYVANGTVCRDVFYAPDDWVSSTVQPDGVALVKLTDEHRLYADAIRIRITRVDTAGPDVDMA